MTGPLLAACLFTVMLVLVLAELVRTWKSSGSRAASTGRVEVPFSARFHFARSGRNPDGRLVEAAPDSDGIAQLSEPHRPCRTCFDSGWEFTNEDHGARPCSTCRPTAAETKEAS